MIRRTDNAHLAAKVRVRLAAVDRIGKDTVAVVDAFSGSGQLWKAIQRQRPDVQFVVTAIERFSRNAQPGALIGDNRKILPTLPLDEYDIVDLDDYGVPHEQLRICAERAPNVPVAVTMCQPWIGAPPVPVIEASLPFPNIVDLFGGREPSRGRVGNRRAGAPGPLFNRFSPTWWWEQYAAALGYRWSEFELFEREHGMAKLYHVLYSGQPE